MLFLMFSVLLLSQKTTIHGGLSISGAAFFVDGATIQTNKMTGFVGGIEKEISLAENLYESIGLEFIQKGYSIKSDTNTYSFRVNYIALPLTTRYKFDLENFWMAFEAGLYAAYALNGNINDGKKYRLEFGKTDSKVRRPDFGFILGYCLEFEYFRIRLAYSTGLYDILPGPDETLKNRSFNVSVGVRF